MTPPRYHRKQPQRSKKRAPTNNASPTSTPIPFQDVIRECLPNTRSAPQPFASMPHDIALCILDQLKDPVDKVCFALTTKALWTVMHEKLRIKMFDLPFILPPRVTRQRGVIQQWPVFQSMRWKLLERLEDHHYWQLCSGCVRLHPKSEFFPDEIGNPPKDRYCKTPGLIQLCPHIYLTYKKCINLQKALLAAPPKRHTKAVGDVLLNEALRHECGMIKDDVTLTFSVQPFISPNLKQLIFHNNYNVKNFLEGKLKESLEKFGDHIMHPCPHHSILTHCLDVNHDGPWDETAVDGDVENRDEAMCLNCDTLYFRFKNFTHSITRKQMIEFTTHRFIGDHLGYGECTIVGRGSSSRLQSWLRKTHLANVIKVDSVCEKCKACTGKDAKYCAKLSFLRMTNPPWKSSLPETRWKRLY